MRDPLDDPRGREAERPADEEEEEWEEEEEEEEEWEEGDEEEDEEEEEEEKAKPAAAKEPAKAEAKPAAPAKGKEEEKKEPAAEKKAPEKKKEEKPPKEKEPSDPIKLGKMLFVAGLCVFFLASCWAMKFKHIQESRQGTVAYYEGATRQPLPPEEPVLQRSTKLDREERGKENEEFQKSYQDKQKEFQDSDVAKEYEVEMAEYRMWKDEVQDDLAAAQKSLGELRVDMGSWAVFRFYFAQIGLILMIVGLAMLLLNGALWESIAALVVLGLGVLPTLTGALGSWLMM